jgi:hypothetical protein
MASALGAEFDKRVRWIRKRFPPSAGRRVSVRTEKNPKLSGVEVQGVTYHFDNGDHLIVIERGPLAPATDTLLHEWAHVLQAESEEYSSDPAEQHSPMWGRIFSEIYREFLKAFP